MPGVLPCVLLLAASVTNAAAAVSASGRRPALAPPPPPGGCHGGPCGGMAHYPVAPGIEYYAEFDVPGMPKKTDGICYYIYFNIFFSGKGHGLMNQFVPQLMLGNSLTGSSGPPVYTPKWIHHDEWTFSSQYFMEINNTKSGNSREGHAATGDAYAAKVGERLWTRFSLSQEYVWTLGMGVVGDEARTSTVVAAKPFMGLVPDDTTSWKEEEYSKCNVNTCWELYGVKNADYFPSTGSTYDISITTKKPNAIDWMTNWNPLLENHGCSNCTMTESHNTTAQTVVWTVKPYHPGGVQPAGGSSGSGGAS
jgi:hypothetical protein